MDPKRRSSSERGSEVGTERLPCRGWREAALSLADLFSIPFLFFFFFPKLFNARTFFLFIFAYFTAFPSHLEPWRMLRVPPRCGELWEPKRLQLRKRDSGGKKITQTHGENTGSCTREALWTPYIVLGCFYLFFFLLHRLIPAHKEVVAVCMVGFFPSSLRLSLRGGGGRDFFPTASATPFSCGNALKLINPTLEAGF